MGRVDGKVAFITGAGMGQGRAHALRLADEGADVIVTDICEPYDADAEPQYQTATREQLDETKNLVEKTGRRCVAAVADVRDRRAMQEAVDEGLDALGHIDVVCANAGVITFHPQSWEIPDATYRLIVDTCLTGVWNTFVTTVPSMVEARRGGSFIVTSSAAGLRGQVGYAHYAAAKHGVVGMMRSFSNELAPHGIRVNTIHPTGVASPGMGTSGGEVAMPLFEANPMMMLAGMNTMRDLDADPAGEYVPVASLEPDEISNAVLFLASDESRYVTGTELKVDAGNTNKP